MSEEIPEVVPEDCPPPPPPPVEEPVEVVETPVETQTKEPPIPVELRHDVTYENIVSDPLGCRSRFRPKNTRAFIFTSRILSDEASIDFRADLRFPVGVQQTRRGGHAVDAYPFVEL